MYIEKVLNNNAFISLDENGDEIIVMGKGIAFGKKGNQKVDLTNLNYKIFSCKNKNINNKVTIQPSRKEYHKKECSFSEVLLVNVMKIESYFPLKWFQYFR